MTKFWKIVLWTIGEIAFLTVCWIGGGKMGEILGNILIEE